MPKVKGELDEVERGMKAMGNVIAIVIVVAVLFILGWWMLYNWKLVLIILAVLGTWSAVLIWRSFD